MTNKVYFGHIIGIHYCHDNAFASDAIRVVASERRTTGNVALCPSTDASANPTCRYFKWLSKCLVLTSGHGRVTATSNLSDTEMQVGPER